MWVGVFVRDRECGLVYSLGIGNVSWCVRRTYPGVRVRVRDRVRVV